MKSALNKKRDVCYVVSLACFACFAILAAVLLAVDVQTAANGGKIGLGTINLAFGAAVGFSDGWYEVSEILGYLTIAVAGANAVVAVVALIRSKSLKGVRDEYIASCVLYVVVVVAYVVFDAFAINYRPTSLAGGELEPSFPSSHVLLALTVHGAEIVILARLVKAERIKIALIAVEGAFALTIVVARTLSGVHWLTDIIGAAILSAAIVAALIGVLYARDDEKMRTGLGEVDEPEAAENKLAE